MSEDPHHSLKIKLEEEFTWPNEYLFKFIFLTDSDAEEKLIGLAGTSAKTSKRKSSTGKYTSLSISRLMSSPEAVISIYKKAELIPGVMSL